MYVLYLYGVDVLLHQPASHPIFGLIKTGSVFIVRSVETDLRRCDERWWLLDVFNKYKSPTLTLQKSENYFFGHNSR